MEKSIGITTTGGAVGSPPLVPAGEWGNWGGKHGPVLPVNTVDVPQRQEMLWLRNPSTRWRATVRQFAGKWGINPRKFFFFSSGESESEVRRGTGTLHTSGSGTPERGAVRGTRCRRCGGKRFIRTPWTAAPAEEEMIF